MSYKVNAHTGKPDRLLDTADITTIGDVRYVKLSDFPFVINGNTYELWFNGVLVHSWTVTPVAPVGRRASLWFLLPNN
jgi:hypothetical protein